MKKLLAIVAAFLIATPLNAQIIPLPPPGEGGGAVTNAGVFAVQEDGAALTALQLIDNMISGSEAQVDIVDAGPIATSANQTTMITALQLIDDIVHLEDVAHGTGDAGVPSWGVANPDLVTTFAASGDYLPHALTTRGVGMVIPVFDGTISTTISPMTIEDAPMALGGIVGMRTMVLRDDALSAGAGTGADGDATFSRVDNFGALWSTPTDGAGNVLALLEDTVHATGDPGIMGLGVVNDQLTTKYSGDDQDLVPFAATQEGLAMVLMTHSDDPGNGVTVTLLEDSGLLSLSPNAGVITLVARDDVLAANAGTNADGDATYPRVDNFGATWAALSGDDGARIPADSDGLKVKPIDAVVEGGLTELVGINEAAMATGTVSDEVSVALAATSSGEILEVCAYQTEDGTGAILSDLDLRLFVFDADPATTVADTDLTAAAAVTVLGQVAFSNANFYIDANSATRCETVAIPFHSLASLFFVVETLGATSINSAAGDDEQVEFNFWYRRDS